MRCEVQGCKAKAQHTLRIPKVRVCEIHFVRHQKALNRLRFQRYYFKLHGWVFGDGIKRGVYKIRNLQRT